MSRGRIFHALVQFLKKVRRGSLAWWRRREARAQRVTPRIDKVKVKILLRWRRCTCCTDFGGRTGTRVALPSGYAVIYYVIYRPGMKRRDEHSNDGNNRRLPLAISHRLGCRVAHRTLYFYSQLRIAGQGC